MSGDDENEKKVIAREFPDNHDGLTTAQAEERLAEYGRNELPTKKTPSWLIFIRGLWGPMPVALWIAIVVELGLQDWLDAGILFVIQMANATIGWYETIKAGDAVAALKQSLKPLATVYRDGEWKEIEATIVVPGDKVKLAAGSAVPADCTINTDPHSSVPPQIDVDEAALTGESLPVTMTPEEGLAKMGSTIVRGEVDGTVQLTGQHTLFGRTAMLLAAVKTDLGNIHRILVTVMYGLTGLSAILCIICFIYLMVHEHASFKTAISFTVVLLIVSIPIAIEIVVTTTLALGSKELSGKKVIVTQLSSIEMMAGVNMLCSDKTGTLTLNKMEIQEYCPVFGDDADRESVLVLAALAAKWREPPRDALDTMVLGAANLDKCDAFNQMEYKPFDPRVKRTEATLRDPEGNEFMVTKGAPNIVLELCANSEEIRDRVQGVITDLGAKGIRCLAVARTDSSGDWRMAGILTFLDPPRPDTKATIANSIRYGVDVKMITGDHILIAKEMARRLNMDTNIGTSECLPQFPESGNPKDIPNTLGAEYGDVIASYGGFAQVHPEHKYLIVETFRQNGYTCAMTGDGVNDAPALKRADVGVAVHGSTDAARAAADMVLTEPGLSVIVDAMLIARGVFQRMLSFITYRISATLQLVTFFFIALFALPLRDYTDVSHLADEARFFHLPVLMFMLITLLNDGTLMTIGYDRVVPQPRPQRWNLPVLFLVAAMMAAVACVSSLLLLWMGLQSLKAYNGSLFHWMGLPQTDLAHLVSMLYLKVSISDFLTLFSARTQDRPFFAFAPSWILIIGAVGSLIISTVVGTVWPESSPDGIPTTGLGRGPLRFQKFMPFFVWTYCIAWWFIQDAVKLATFALLKKTHFLGYGLIVDPSLSNKKNKKQLGKQAGAAASSSTSTTSSVAYPEASTHHKRAASSFKESSSTDDSSAKKH
jgi:H+-transporting ATPase